MRKCNVHLWLRKCEKLPQTYRKLADLRLRNTSYSFAELSVNLRCPALLITALTIIADKPFFLIVHSITFLGNQSKSFVCQQNTYTTSGPSIYILLHSLHNEHCIHCSFSWHKSKLYLISTDRCLCSPL